MGGIRKFLFIGGFIVFFILLITFLFTNGDDSGGEASRKKGELDAVSSLLGGGSRSSSGSAGTAGAAGSVFDSDFFRAGKGEYVETEKQESGQENRPDAADADNPVNPQTGKPYTNEEMDRFQQLKERFPGNSLIPSKLSPAEKEQRKQFEQTVSEATRAVLGRTASREQTVTYYDFMEKQAKDRLDIVTYLVDLQKGSGDEEQEKKLEAIRQSMVQQLDQVQQDKRKSFEQIGK
ncbi:hypothetical protein LEP1GSC058_0832 [Leptospira fainei serovar Hurstbridge str. BUT 6]|uniref:Lipoprotein n=1 Tax=Leptospira fainei serovar Hurstbridge str. BUT 6 TaxID=1193011 RepID=S3V3H5_9LEPT|nr:hypothetical protein [Leptospira fainei]EPG75958.1 hypothetical protein LEP1GSC058_0832 [Leptospira fainei serovar Hurstbridge str. BUT 6]